MNLFSVEIRRNPYPVYDQLRAASPLLLVPPPFDAWMIFDYDSVKWALNDHETFSSRVPAPRNWFILFDPPAHTKLRVLISRAFTPRMIANLEPHPGTLARAAGSGYGTRRNGYRRRILGTVPYEGDCRHDRHPSPGLVAIQALERHNPDA